jgi:hypothetical protein
LKTWLSHASLERGGDRQGPAEGEQQPTHPHICPTFNWIGFAIRNAGPGVGDHHRQHSAKAGEKQRFGKLFALPWISETGIAFGRARE